MRGSMVCVAVSLAACGSSSHGATDAGADASPDAPVCRPLLTGGSDVVAQGWTLVMQGPATLSNGPDHAALHTSTSASATSGGQLLLVYPAAVETGMPFKIAIEMLVEQVDPHNPFDSAAAILGSFTPPFGTIDERAQMIYLDGNQIGWADDTDEVTLAVTGGAYHTYELAVDAAGGGELRVDGIKRLTRVNFTTNGAIAIGDQTNDARIDSTLRIRSVTRLCP